MEEREPQKMCHSGLSLSLGDKEVYNVETSRNQSEKPYKPTRICPSPISSIVGTALNQMNLKRSSSAPMINQLGTQGDTRTTSISTASTPVRTSNHLNNEVKDLISSTSDSESSSYANGFLASFSGTRPRRFSASFSPGSPGLAPSRVSQLRQENSNSTDWESASEKEFHGNANIAQSWEDLSLDSMSMEVSSRRPSFSDQLWLTMPGSTSLSASSSPTASPRVVSRFSPSLSSPSPTRKSFTSRRSLSPIAIRPSVLSVGQGVKRKCDWDSNQMDCSPQPAKRAGGLLSLQQYNQCVTPVVTSSNVSISVSSTINHSIMISSNNHNILSQDLHPRHSDSPNSIETESSVSSNGDSPFFRPLDSPLTSDDSPHPK